MLKGNNPKGIPAWPINTAMKVGKKRELRRKRSRARTSVVRLKRTQHRPSADTEIACHTSSDTCGGRTLKGANTHAAIGGYMKLVVVSLRSRGSSWWAESLKGESRKETASGPGYSRSNSPAAARRPAT